MRYAGDRTGDYDHGRGTGLVGKVVGPSAHGQWWVVESASYDAETDATTTVMKAISPPEQQFERVMES